MAKSRRQRGVLLTPAGLRRLQAARQTLEGRENTGEPFTLEQLSERAELDINTIKRALSTDQRVDRRTLTRLFSTFGLEFGPSDYTTPNRPRRQDWGGAVSAAYFYGRQQELATLTQWVGPDRCRAIAIYGVAGIGKTSLALEAARQWQDRFEGIVWRSLRDPDDPAKLLQEIVEFLDPEAEVDPDASYQHLLTQLVQNMQQQRCLLILDNVESLFQSGVRAGEYHLDCMAYGEMLQRLGEAEHQSCLLLTTREKPREIAALEGDALPVRSLRLEGFREQEETELLAVRGIDTSPENSHLLARQYGGNPLALTLVASTIRDVFAGDVAAFVAQRSTVYGDLRDLLARQFERLSAAERDILYWLAINREPTSLAQLRQDMTVRPERPLLETLESLLRRAVLERNASRFSCQPVVLEYVSECLLKEVYDELVADSLHRLHTHALYKAQGKDFIRDAQRRVFLEPLLDRLAILWQSKKQVAEALSQQLRTLQEAAAPPSYAAGNLVNLLRQFNVDFSGKDFSDLVLWQADFQEVLLHDCDFRRSDLSSARFTQYLGSIRDITFSPDGRFFATGDTNGELYLYRTDDGRQLSRIGHQGWLWSITYSPDGTVLASGGEDCAIELWDADSGEHLTTLCGHEDSVRALHFTPDPNSTILASGSEDGTVRLWDLESDRCVQILGNAECAVVTLAISPNGQSLASSDGSIIHLWHWATGKRERSLMGHNNAVSALAFHPQGKVLASGSNDCTICLWDLDSSEDPPAVTPLQGHHMSVSALAFSPDGDRLVSSSDDGTVRVWQVATGECIRILNGHRQGSISAVAFSADNRTIASGSLDCTIQLWDVDLGRTLRSHRGYGNGTQAIAFSPDGKTVAICRQQFVDLWDVATGYCRQQLQASRQRLTAAAFSPDGQNLVCASLDNTVKVWDVNNGRSHPSLQGHRFRVLAALFSPDGKILATASEDCQILLWDWERRQRRLACQGHDRRIWSLAFSPSGQRLASASHDNTLRLWDVATGSCLWVGTEHEDYVWSVAFSPDGRSLISGGNDGSLKIWDADTGVCQRSLTTDSYIFSVAFSPDGGTIASGHSDGAIYLWDATTGERQATLPSCDRGVWAVVFSPDGKTLASTGNDETTMLWDFKACKHLTTLRSPRPYERMNVMDVLGLTTAKLENLKALGAVIGLGPDEVA